MLALAGYVEHAFGVWYPGVAGGLHAIPELFAARARELGAEFFVGETVRAIEAGGGRARAVVTDARRLEADAVVFGGDARTLGGLLAVLLARYPHSPWLRPFLAVGVLGGFTTYSTFAMDVVRLTGSGHPVLAVGYVLASVLGGACAVVAGLVTARAAIRAAETVDAELRAGEGTS